MKKVRFQFCSEGVERESGIAQVHRERVPHGRRGVVEPSWTQCLCLGSWDVPRKWKKTCEMWPLDNNGEGQWPRGRVVASEPGGPGFDSSSRQPQFVAHQHWARWITATPSLVLCCAGLVTMALHVHCGLGQLSPLPTSVDDKWVALQTGRAEQN